METKIRQKIELNVQGKAKLAKAFGITNRSVSHALTFKRNSPQSFKIREAALRMGGRLIEMNDVTVSQTVKVLNSKGEVVKAVVMNDATTL